MPCRLIFRCEFCDALPDEDTHKGLTESLSLLMFGTYVDVEPGNWLVWQGRGIYGPTRYACAVHRGTLKANLRKHYGTLGPHPHVQGPHPVGMLRRETSEQMRRRRALMSYRKWSTSHSHR